MSHALALVCDVMLISADSRVQERPAIRRRALLLYLLVAKATRLVRLPIPTQWMTFNVTKVKDKVQRG